MNGGSNPPPAKAPESAGDPVPLRIHCRLARPEDAPILTAFNERLAAETEGRPLVRAAVEGGVLAVLADPQKGRYFVAEKEGRIVGQAGLTWEWSDWRNGVFWWLQSVYVEPAARHQGVFKALFEHLNAEARATPGCCGLRLYVEHHNAIALEVYTRLGLRRAGFEMLEIDFTGLPAPRPAPPRS